MTAEIIPIGQRRSMSTRLAVRFYGQMFDDDAIKYLARDKERIYEIQRNAKAGVRPVYNTPLLHAPGRFRCLSARVHKGLITDDLDRMSCPECASRLGRGGGPWKDLLEVRRRARAMAAMFRMSKRIA